ncbi:MAG: ABC transporter substrate-binding protein [Blastocatellia bacterium]|nr:ABC transporter substrate-binding protein [Blastocatellia bacterium]
MVAIVAVLSVSGYLLYSKKNIPAQLPIIAVVTLQSHPILDTVQENLLADLKNEGLEDGKNIQLVLRNANGQMQAVPTIANEIASQNPRLIIAITTPMAQAVKKVAKCPVVFGAVTDPEGAGLFEGEGQGNITGTSDAVPYDQQLRLIKRIKPGVTRLGVLFNPGEASSKFAMTELRKFAPEMGIALVEGSVNTSGDVYAVAQSLAGKVDALLISTDNTVAVGIAAAVKVASEKKIPLFACDSGSVEKGALAAVSAGYPQVGIDTGRLAVKMFNGEKNLPFLKAQGSEIYLNQRAAEMMSTKIPDDVVANATKVLTEIKD